jgi:uncharacterized UPF0160 family protein
MDLISAADIVVDVGGKYDADSNRFDHHQEGGAGSRENGIPYASFGLVWKKYGLLITGSNETADRIDRKIIQTIDALDNGVDMFTKYPESQKYLIHDLIFAFKPSWNEYNADYSYDDAFFRVLPLVREILEREIKIATDNMDGEKLALDAYKRSDDKQIVVLGDSYPWRDVFRNIEEIMFVVSPDLGVQGNWKVSTIMNDPMSFESRMLLPESWAGKRDEELQSVTGVEDAVFCHNARFIAVAKSKDGALKLAQLALESK